MKSPNTTIFFSEIQDIVRPFRQPWMETRLLSVSKAPEDQEAIAEKGHQILFLDQWQVTKHTGQDVDFIGFNHDLMVIS